MTGGRGRSGRRRTASPTRIARPRRTSAPRRPAAYPLLSPAEVLRAIVAFSRDVTADMGDELLFDLFFRTLEQLLPNRLVAVRVIDPRSLLVTQILAERPLAPGAQEMPPTVQRGALDFANVRRNLPADLRARDGSRREIRLAEEHPLLLEGAVAGFSVPLVAGGELTGEVHVNYGPVETPEGAARRPLPLKADKGLVIPLANHVAVVAHTRRLLRETVYLQDYLGQLIDQASVLMAAVDTAGRVTVWNRAMARLTGFARSRVVGQDLLSWLQERSAPDLGQVIKQVSVSGATTNREVRLPTVGGTALRAAFNVVTIRGADGKPAATLAIGQDVTALRQLQSQVIHAEKLATVGQIAAGVAHEINNPLTSVQVCAEALLRKATMATQGRASGVLDRADLDRLQKVKEGAERIRRFARDLVSYARPSGSEIEPVRLNEVIDQALSFCEHVIFDARAKIDRDFAGELPIVQAVRDQLLQVVTNLVTNAAHAVAGRGGTIRVRTWDAGGGVVGFAVSDDGVGIKEEDRAKIFDPFFTTKPAGRGTGLGLSVVRNIVYAHGGQISFQTRAGSGTTFMITLPVIHLGAAAPEGAFPST